MIIATFDLSSGWSFDGDADVDFAVRFADGDAERIYPDSLAYGYVLTVEGVDVGADEWPPPNALVREVSTSRVFHHRFVAAPEASVVLRVWARESGHTTEAEHEFVVPRPPQPFPSWTWSDGTWNAPTPPPNDGQMYRWDEQTMTWQAT